MGTGTEILWPNSEAMSAIADISCRHYATATLSALDLLWPAQLINEQARLKEHHNLSQPLATVGFVLSLILAIIVGPVQMVLVATILDYNWVTASYFPTALHAVLICAGIVALIDLLALAVSWTAQPKHTYITMLLVGGSLAEIALIWLTGKALAWPPHTLTLALILTAAIFIILVLLLNRQFISRSQNSAAAKFGLSLLMATAVAEASLSIVYVLNPPRERDPVNIEQIASEQTQAKLPEIPIFLSNLTFALCDGKYQDIYLAKDEKNGIFECSNSGEVYSVADINDRGTNTIRGAATYLGTTKDTSISLSFPNAYYLYRSVPEALEEDELALMIGASTEQELLDNITDPLLSYWNGHSERNLFVNIFYNNNLENITSTRDFILMSAMETMAMIDKLPHGNTLQSHHDGKIVPYIYQPDTDLIALNELGSNPDLYATATRDALVNHRHISIHLTAGQTYEHSEFYRLLQSSFIGGIESYTPSEEHS